MASYFKRVAKLGKSIRLTEVNGMIQRESKVTEVEIAPIVNHVICIDVSGSMYRVLPKIRTQLKSKLVDIVGDNDTVTLIKFDDRGSIISNMVKVSKASDVREMNRLIDKELIDGGCTNFLDPVRLSDQLIDRMANAKGLWNFFFMSDGGHNTGGTWDEVCSKLHSLQSKVSNATICEYGYWADSERLTQMAEMLGGQKIFDKDFEEYQNDFAHVMKTGSTLVKRVQFDITEFKSSMKYQFMFTVNKNEKAINVYSTERSNYILIPENTDRIYFLQKDDIDASNKMDEDQLSAAYAAVHILASRLKYDQAEEILYGIKDKEMIELYCNSFGKQRLEDFKSEVLKRTYGETKCTDFIKDGKYRPNTKKYCMFDFINDLTSSDDNLIHVTHPDFSYNATTAKSVAKVELNDDDRDKLSKSSTKLKADKILKSAAKYQVGMKITNPEAGYSVDNIVWNNERANLSVMVRIPVTLTVPEESNPAKTFEMSSFITRNYTLIKDGILNVTDLIVTISSNTLAGKFKRMGLVKDTYEKNMFKLDISSIPVINKKYTELTTSKDLSEDELALLRYRAINKYLAYLKKDSSSKSVSSTENSYLKSLGITDKGYNPKSELDKTGDFYMSPYLETKLEKFSNLPKVEDVLRKRQLGKLMTVSESFMNEQMKFVDDSIDNELVDGGSYDEILLSTIKTYKDAQKKVMTKISQTKFSIIVSRKWFKDKTDFNDDTVVVEVCDTSLRMRFVFSEKRVDL